MSIVDLRPVKFSVKTFRDERGWLKKLRPADTTLDKMLPASFSDVYLSKSRRHVFRGLHLQSYSFSQFKLIRVFSGKIHSYVLNLDNTSASFGMLYKFKLHANEDFAVLCPPLHANGFLSLSNNTTIAVIASRAFNPDSEIVISPLSIEGIQLPSRSRISRKDLNGFHSKHDIHQIVQAVNK